MTRYQETIKGMLEEHKALFDEFKKVHDYYALNPKRYQTAFNIQGEKVVEIIRQYERKLCGHSERGQYAKYSSQLADKFWEQIRELFPKIDFVGAITD